MAIALDYASPKFRRLPLRGLGTAAALVAIASSVIVIIRSVRLAQQAQLALMVPTTCGTGRHEAEELLMFLVPWMLVFPAGAWVVSRFAGYAQLACRCSLWSAVLGWAVSVVFVVFRHSL
jgi:hypothetical protein